MKRAIHRDYVTHPSLPCPIYYLYSRGLEDHYADLIGKTNSYYIRKRHEELVLREYRRYQHRMTPAQLTERVAAVAAQDSEDDLERALDVAKLDECMAKPAGAHGATTSPVSAQQFTSGEAFLHTLIVRLRDYA